MKKNVILFFSSVLILTLFIGCGGQNKNEPSGPSSETLTSGNISIQGDSYQTSKGELKVFLIGHGSLMFEFDGKIIHVDPYSKIADYTLLPKADIVLLTHDHSDHLDTLSIRQIKKDDTKYIVTEDCNAALTYGQVMVNGDKLAIDSLLIIEAVPAYNIKHKNEQGNYYHPKGIGNGYIISFGNKNVYIAADTENIPEMDSLKGKIDIAFLPKNLPYTMDDEMFIDAAKRIQPKYLYPYHFKELDETKIGDALKESNIELMIRPMSNL